MRTMKKIMLDVLEAACVVRDLDYQHDPSAAFEELDRAVDAYREAQGFKEAVEEIDPATLKPCGKCHRSLPIGEFPVAKARGRVYVRNWCPDCMRQYYREAKQRGTA